VENPLSGIQLESACVPVRARLKWFNVPKGFGFVNPENRLDIDAFLHITTLQQAGVQIIGEEASLICEIEYGEKGAHVKQVIEIIDAGNLPKELFCGDFSYKEGDQAENKNTRKMTGIVKWYKEEEGFGFIIPEDGLKDVFIHKTCLERHKIKTLESGQKISMIFRNVPKGREVLDFDIIS